MIWRLKLAPKARRLYNTIKRYETGHSDCCAGDPDQEGRWVVDAVLEQIGINTRQRVLISDLNPPAVRKALRAMPDNAQYRGLRDAAVGHARADWLYGLNLTETLHPEGTGAGLSGVLSVGRVQTPVLGLVVRRDREIADFQAHPFYAVEASVTADGADSPPGGDPASEQKPTLTPTGV